MGAESCSEQQCVVCPTGCAIRENGDVDAAETVTASGTVGWVKN
jgi:hypothetical protein